MEAPKTADMFLDEGFKNTPWAIANPPTDNFPEEALKAIKQIDNYDVDTVLYTDGSCKGGTEDGGAAVIVSTGSARSPVILETLLEKGSKITCSYLEEVRAMTMALNWLTKESPAGNTVICTDSLSLLTALGNRVTDTEEIRDPKHPL